MKLLENEPRNINGPLYEASARDIVDAPVDDDVGVQQLRLEARLSILPRLRRPRQPREEEVQLFLHAEGNRNSEVHADDGDEEYEGNAKLRDANEQYPKKSGHSQTDEDAQDDGRLVPTRNPAQVGLEVTE